KYYESDKLFFQDNSPAFISHYDAFGRISYAWAAGRRGKALIGIGGGRSHDRFYSNDRADFLDSSPEQTAMDMVQAIGRFQYSTLDNESYPASGSFVKLTAMQTLGKYSHRRDVIDRDTERYSTDQHWFQAEVECEHYIPVGSRFSFGVQADVLVSNRKLLNTYYASIVNAPSFTPSASMEDVFNKAFHANSFAAAGITPVWQPFQRAQVRLSANMFLPFRKILQAADGIGVYHGRWFADPEFAAELDLVYNLPFASVCGYVNYLSFPARNWNVGLSFGLYFTAAKFLR
ncbi:MAG: hypothetical protein K2L78_04695, partial [Muribaculaceae bacterium]|nr:hypothetical protein [Muribaculaceae bacterium]